MRLRLFTLREMVTCNEPDLLPHRVAAAQSIVDYALAKWPANRFVSAQDMANSLWAVSPSQHIPVGTAASVGMVSDTQSVLPGQSVVSLQQAVNRSLTLAPAAALHSRGTRGWRRFLGGRRQSSSSAAV